MEVARIELLTTWSKRLQYNVEMKKIEIERACREKERDGGNKNSGIMGCTNFILAMLSVCVFIIN